MPIDYESFDDDGLDRLIDEKPVSSRRRRSFRYGGGDYYGYDNYYEYGGSSRGWWNSWAWGQKDREVKTALEVDLFGERRGRELAWEWDRDKESKSKGIQHDPNVAADCHAALYEPIPVLTENVEKEEIKVRQDWFKSMMETNDYKTLHAQTCLDQFVSEMSSQSVCRAYTLYYEEYKKNKAEGKEPGIEGEMGKIRGIREALSGAAATAKAVTDACEGLGMGGDGPGGDGRIDKEALKKAFGKVKNSNLLSSIFERAGRMWRFAAGAQRMKVTHGVDEIVGIEMADEIPRAVMQEMSMLMSGVEPIQLDAMRRMAEGQMICRKHKGFERVGKGPIITVVDESGSMSGEPIITAKAIALTMARIAKHQKRWAGFVGFSGGSEGTRLAMPPNKWDSTKLMSWLEHFYSGGTDLDVPVIQMPDKYWPEFVKAGMPVGKTDVVFITDACLSAPPAYVAKFTKWKHEQQVKAYGIIVRAEPGDMAKLCDQCWTVDSMTLAEEAVQTVLSI